MIYGRFLVNPARVISVVCNAMNDKASPHLAWADFKIQPPRLLTKLKNESFPNNYSSFWPVEATDFKNIIQNPLGGFWGCWGLEIVFKVTEAKISKTSSHKDSSL